MLKEICCGSVVFSKKDGQLYVLLTQNLQGRHWSFPKGHVEGSETRLETAQREVFEETGVHINPIEGYLGSVSYSTRGGSVKTVWYFVSIVPHESALVPQPEEVSAIRWVPFSQAGSVITYRRDYDLLVEAHNYLLNHPEVGQCF